MSSKKHSGSNVQPADSVKKLAASLLEMLLENDKCCKIASITHLERDQKHGNVGQKGAKKSASEEKETEEGVENEVTVLRRLASDASITTANFPVYGVVKAGKSTFLSCLLRQKLLPEQALPMTSIPIKLKHKAGAKKKLFVPQHLKWNKCIAAFKVAHTNRNLKSPIVDGDLSGADQRMIDTQKSISDGKATLSAVTEDEEGIRQQLDFISHFVRLLWLNEIDFEKDFGISLDVDQLPYLEISMSAFEDMNMKDFSFIDTPGPNEAKALEALVKMGPKVMRVSSGCIFCIPWDQVESDAMYQLYNHINQWMKGKRIIVILTKMDSFKDSKDSVDNICAKIMTYFVPSNRSFVTIHPTSGHKLYMLYMLQHFLDSNSSTIPLMKRLDAEANAELHKDLLGYMTKATFTQMAAMPNQDLFKYLKAYLKEGLVEVKADDLSQCFRDLYHDAEVIALAGHVTAIEQSHVRFSKQLADLRHFVDQDDTQRQKLQDNIKAIKDEYARVFAELTALPADVSLSVRNHLREGMVESLQKWGRDNNKTWTIVERDTGLSREEFQFPGGKAGMRIWFNESAKPVIVGHMSAECRKVLDVCKKELPGIISRQWKQCSDLVRKLAAKVTDATGISDLQIWFDTPPTISFDVEMLVKQSCEFDVSKINYRETGDTCTIITSEFTLQMAEMFGETMKQVASTIQTQVCADLQSVFDKFKTHVGKEKVHAAELVEKTEKVMKDKLIAADFKESFKKISYMDVDFQECLTTAKHVIQNMKQGASKLPPPGFARGGDRVDKHPGAEETKRQSRTEDDTSQHVNSHQKAEPMKVLARNLRFDVTENCLREAFESYGSIQKTFILRDDNGVSKGAGFVMFANKEDALKVLERRTVTFRGQTISVSPENSKPVQYHKSGDDDSSTGTTSSMARPPPFHSSTGFTSSMARPPPFPKSLSHEGWPRTDGDDRVDKHPGASWIRGQSRTEDDIQHHHVVGNAYGEETGGYQQQHYWPSTTQNTAWTGGNAFYTYPTQNTAWTGGNAYWTHPTNPAMRGNDGTRGRSNGRRGRGRGW